MLGNYIKITFRTLARNKFHSLINVFGLAIALTSCILIFLFVQDELAFDSFHSSHQNIYRIIESRTGDDNAVRKFPFTAGPAAAALRNDFPVVEKSVKMIPRNYTGRFTIQFNDNKFYEGSHFFTEPSFFDVFDFELKQGNKSSLLNEPNAVVITESAAKKYFGDENPLNKILTVERIGDVKVKGVLKDLPANSHLQFNMLFSLATLEANENWKKWINSWNSDGFLTYIKLKEGTGYKELENNLAAFNIKYRGEEAAGKSKLHLQALDDIHFYSSGIEEDINYDAGNIEYVYIFSAAALFILLIASINFINLTTARSSRRAKEVGMRKVMGAFRIDLIRQFLGETFVLTSLSIIAAILFVEILLPSFNDITGKSISNNYLENCGLAVFLVLFLIFSAVIAGSYPAFVLSGFEPASVLKGQSKINFKNPVLRRVLVVLQFSLSAIIITATIAAYNQLDFIQSKSLGFNKEAKIIIDINSSDSRKNFKSIKNEFAKNPNVLASAVSSRVPGDWKDISQVDAVPAGKTDNRFRTYFYAFDEDIIPTYEFKLVEGRNFSASMGTDSASLIINETAAKIFGWKEPLGKVINIPDENFKGTVIGVVKDFHFQSLHQKIEPVIIGYWYNPVEAIDYYTVKIKTADISSTLSYLQDVHEQLDKYTPFEFNFLDERINDFYLKDQRTAKLFGIAAVLAIIIACLGLSGLASYITELRTKEIGIRKVLGATVPSILNLISKEFVLLVLAANLAALPVSYWFMNEWLQEFAYRIKINPYTFLLTAAVVLIISLLTIGYQALKAAAANPAKILKIE